MKSKFSLIVVAVFVVLATVIVANKQSKNEVKKDLVKSTKTITNNKVLKKSKTEKKNTNLPQLIDLGSHNCVPCKMMMPVLDTLRTIYAGKLKVTFIDVWEDRAAGEKYGIKVIPTQIGYDANGKELFRHEGFLSRKDIENKMKEAGVKLGNNL